MKAIGRALLEPIRARIEYSGFPADAKAEIKRDRRGLLFDDPGPEAVCKAGIDWLGVAQDSSPNGDGGVARHYGLVDGWGNSYPETTGYIVPTLLDWHSSTGSEDALRRAETMLRWFVGIQFEDGGFQGGMIGAQPLVPVTFNTGQILIGLAAGVRALGDEYRDAMHKAADWLVTTQDADGAWRSHPTPFAHPGEKAYETHVSWGLFEAARADESRGYGEAGARNVDWALSKQRDNGWFADCCLDKPDTPLTHTLGYVVRGVLECWRYTGERRYLDAAVRTLGAIARLVDDDGRLPGRFDANWNPAVSWVCVTGSSQLAECMLIAGTELDSADLIGAGRRLNRFVRRTIRVDGPEALRGAVKGAYPVDGAYGRMQYLNWAVKFTIDSNEREQRL